MVIGTCGFVGTGSSAVSDYIKEFSEVSGFDLFEFIITHGPDGLEDLDFQLNEHCVKYTSSVVAIERFRSNFYNYLLRHINNKQMKGELVDVLEKYIRSITQVSWCGYGAVDSQLFGQSNYKHPRMNMVTRRAGKRLYKVCQKASLKQRNSFPMYDMRLSIQPDNFVESSRQFISDIFRTCGVDTEKKIVLDQPFSAINPSRSFKFFDDPKAIVVDRDPCDLYLLTKRYFHPLSRAFCVPTDTVDNFIEYFRTMRNAMRKNLNASTDRILFVQFEDLIYKYDETRKRINDFCDLHEENRVNHFFDPKLSIANTQLIKRYPDEKENIDIIRDKLKEYVYDFEQFGDVDTSGEMFPNRSPLNK